MVHTIPLALPVEFVDKYAIDLTARSSDGWVFAHVGAEFGPDGDMYVLSRLWRYKPQGEDAEDPAQQSVSAWLVARHPADGDGTPAAFAVFLTPTRYSKFGDASALDLAVLPDGNVALTGTPDATYLLDGALTRVLRSYTTQPRWSARDAYVLGDPFATRLKVTPGGRLLCLVAEYGLRRDAANLAPNLIALTDEALTAKRRPPLRAIAALSASPVPQDADADAYISCDGQEPGMVPRPAPGLAETLWPPRFSRPGHGLGRPVPLAEDRFVVPLFGRLRRGGTRGNDFAFVLMDDSGKVLGRLEGMDRWRDSPYTGGCYDVAADPARGRVFHLNRYGLYAWSADGTLVAKVPTDDKPFTLLKNFALLGCGPDGELLLVQEKQNLLVRLPVPHRGLADGLAPAIAAGLAAFGKQRPAIKKQWTQVEWRWTYRPAPGRLHFL